MKKLLLSLLLLLAFLLPAVPGSAGSVTGTLDRSRPPGHKGVQVASSKGPAVALLETVPPLAGVTFQIAGQQYVTGADGSVAVIVPQPGTYDLQVLTDTFHDPYRRIEFSRWLSETFEPTRQIHLPASGPVQVGLNIYELVGQKFVDLQGHPVDPSRIKQFSIRSLQGDAFTFTNGQPRWIPASRVTRRRAGGLEQVPLLYTVTEVVVDGSNVVNKAQQQFYTQPNGIWTISLLFYSLRVNAVDALFGFPQGKQLRLKFPNGLVHDYPLDQNGTVQLYSLARGNYTFQVLGAKGLASTAPIALSKDQVLTARVVSLLDLEVVGAFGLLVAVGLVIFGRLSLRRARNREQRRQSTLARA